ncbi:unnamed protein product, partial [Allacma fusca]
RFGCILVVVRRQKAKGEIEHPATLINTILSIVPGVDHQKRSVPW